MVLPFVTNAHQLRTACFFGSAQTCQSHIAVLALETKVQYLMHTKRGLATRHSAQQATAAVHHRR
jgi:hypothetical protein